MAVNLMLLICVTCVGQGSGSDTKNQRSNEMDKQLLDVVYMSLINIGDLYRYLTDVCSKDKESYLEYFQQAQDYYSQVFSSDLKNLLTVFYVLYIFV